MPVLGEILLDPAAFRTWGDQALTGMNVLSAIARTRALDHLGDTPRSANEIAADAGVDADQLGRMLSFLAAEQVLIADDEGRYSHTEASRGIQSTHPDGTWPILYVSGRILAIGAVLDEALATGVLAQKVAYGMNYFECLARDPGLAEAFARFMTQSTKDVEGFLFANHAFESFTCAVDIGGNRGSLIARLLERHPEARGILFDLPETVAAAGPALAASAARARITTIGGDFFVEVPKGGDLYLLKQVLHDWDDAACRTILRNIRHAIAPGGRLAVIDRLMPERPEPHPAYVMDIYMLQMTGGRERKCSEFTALLADSGFAVVRVTEDPRFPCVIEAVPV